MYVRPYFYNMMDMYNYEQMNNEMLFGNMMRCYDNRSSLEKEFTIEEVLWIAKNLSVRFDKFDVEQFRVGLNVELEHGTINPVTNVTNDDPIITGKIALAHLNEFPDYYKRLKIMEEEAEKYWGEQ
jgi:DNA-directed RNA polymerase alpha subunit